MKHLFKSTEFQLDEILFENRNKSYGAYVLRQNSDKVLAQALFMSLAIFGFIAIMSMVFNNYYKTGSVTKPPLIVYTIDNVERSDHPKNAVKPNIKPKPIATYNSTVPTPSDIDDVQQTPVNHINKDNAQPGFTNTDGDKPNDNTITIPQNIPQNPIPVDDNKPFTDVEVEANFIGGINAFRNLVANNFDTSEFEGTGESISTKITFIVEKDGSITNIKANGKNVDFNKEAEKSIKAIKGKWTPAKIGGKSVRSYFSIPISMVFE